MHPSSIGRIFRKIKKQQIEKYFSALQEGLIEQKREVGDDDKLTLALDSTSISSYANKLPNVERGRNKDEDNLPQINLLMLVESKSGRPSSIEPTMETFRMYKLSDELSLITPD